MSRFANLSARLAGRTPVTASEPGEPKGEPINPDEPSGAPDPEDQIEEDQDMPNDTPLEEREDYRAGHAAGAAAATARMNAVFAHANTAGREAHAMRLLGRASLSADEIGEELAHFAVAAPAAPAATLTEAQQREAAEAGGRAEMQEAMAAAGNADLGATGDAPSRDARASADAVWAAADTINARYQGSKE